MRLIDADAVKTVDYSGLSYIAPNDYQGIAEYFYKQLISYQPTAYDVDGVVDELNNEFKWHDSNRSYWQEHSWKDNTVYNEKDLNYKQADCFEKAISIVKGAVQG